MPISLAFASKLSHPTFFMKNSNMDCKDRYQRKAAPILILFIAVIAPIIFTPNLIQANKNHETYIVKPGDTLWQLACSRGYSIEMVKKLNRLNSDLIRPNQKLIFPKKAATQITKTTPVAPSGKSIKVVSTLNKPAHFAKANPSVYSLPLNQTSVSGKAPSVVLTNPRTVPLDPPSHIAESRPIRSASGNRSQVKLNTQEREVELAKEPDFDFDQVFDDDIRVSPNLLQQPNLEKNIVKNEPSSEAALVSITRKMTQSSKHKHSTKSRPMLSIREDTPSTSSLLPKTEPKSVQADSPTSRFHTRLPGRATEHMRSEIRRIAAQKIRYKGAWRPPGETVSWIMDCSNTTRWLYQRVTGVDIGRTASDQYMNLRSRGRVWNVPKDSFGNPDKDFLDKNLRPGDLLFWEHTYRPIRWPAITHVAIYLGKDEKGRHLMAASNSSGTATRRGGPNIYVFRPEMNFGGYRPIGSSRYRHGRFVAFGRPIDNLDRQTFARDNQTLRDLYQ
jgi:cell wall-associated NlpC family hydrolase